MAAVNFDTKLTYHDRESKHKFVYEKYKDILKGSILDVGADELHLKKYLPQDVEYKGVGLGDNPALIKLDLEKDKFAFADNEFDCVLCLDVLEHIENTHQIFDQLCRVSKQWVIISLPNPWSALMDVLQNGKYSPEKNTKFYGLPLEREPDRHKWFFSASEAREFVNYRAQKNGFEVVDTYVINEGSDGILSPTSLSQRIKVKLIKRARKLIFRNDLQYSDLYEGTLWWVLKKVPSSLK